MGVPFVGIIHPCKLYSILAVGAPVLSIGPQREPCDRRTRGCAVYRIVCAHRSGRYSDALVACLLASLRALEPATGAGGESLSSSEFGAARLLPKMVELILR